MIGAESIFAIDSTGFSLPHKDRWVKVRLDGQKEKMSYKKLHMISGVHTKVITSATITGASRNDSPEFEFLLKDTARRFRIREVCADAGYLSRKNCGLAEEVGAVPYIMPKSNTGLRAGGVSAWRQMLLLWKNNREEFKEHYHKRSNAESAFSAMKRKFSGYIRSKGNTSQTNEIFCKVVCHNVSVLVNSIFTLGAEAEFEKYDV
jgi:transposase